MSLLLNARKKIQQACSVQPEAGAGAAIPQAEHRPRDAGHNLFAAKHLLPMAGYTLPNRNLFYALGGMILLLAAGLAYAWHVNFSNSTMQPRPVRAPPAITESAIRDMPATADGNTGKIQPDVIAVENAAVAPQPRSHGQPPPNNSPIRIERQKTEPVDPLLGNAYLAYRGGRLDEARQLYLAMLAKDARNHDALLGLAAIAQQRAESQAAAQYFGRALALDPRNAEANAGMSALSADEDYSESRLKILLREQGNSAALHFALGNLYAGQLRWGEAQHAYFNADVLEPGNAEYAFNLAVSLDHLGQGKLAAQHYRRAMQLDTSHSAGFDHAQISQRAQELAH